MDKDDMKQIFEKMGEIKSRQDSIEKRMDGLEVRIESQLKDIKQSMSDFDEKFNEILTTLNQARGGWKVITMAGGILLVFGSALTWIVDKLLDILK